MGTERLLKVDEAAAMLGFSVATLYRWSEHDALPHVRIGRSLRFRPEALQAFLGKNERAVEPAPGEPKGRS